MRWFISLMLSSFIAVAQPITLTTQQAQTSNIKSAHPKVLTLTPLGRFVGDITTLPKDTMAVTLSYEAQLMRLHVLPHEKVSKGHVLATLKSHAFIDAQQRALSAQKSYGYAKEQALRNKELCQSKFLAQTTCIKDKNRLMQATIDVNSALTQLKRFFANDQALNAWKKEGKVKHALSLHAQQSGVITHINYQVGQTVTPQKALLNMQDDAPKSFHVALPLHKSRYFTPNTQLRIIINGTAYDARVISRAPTVDTQSQTQQIYCVFAHTYPHLLSGMRVYATLHAQTKSLRIPKSGLILLDNAPHVFIQNKQEFSPAKVTVLYEDATYAYLEYEKHLDTSIVTDNTIILKNSQQTDDD